MSTLKANNLQIGQSATATQNFVLSVPASPDGTIKLSRGNQGATTADVLSVDASGNVTAALTAASIPNGGVTSAKLGATENLRIAKAWVNFNGTTATPSTIRSSYNVSSITKTGTGQYTINFTNAFADTNYSVLLTAYAQTSVASNLNSPVAYATTSLSIQHWENSVTADSSFIHAIVFGN